MNGAGSRARGDVLWSIVGIIAVRYIFLPLLGVAVVRGVVYLGWADSDPLFVFILLLQYALPPAMNLGTISFQK